MSIVSERLRYAMKLRNMKQVDLVEKTGIGKSSISTYLSGEYFPKQTNTYKLAEALRVNPSWLMGNDVPMEDTSFLPENVASIRNVQLTRIPLIGNVAAGQPILAEEDYETYIDSPCKADYALRVEGDSMEPGFIDGDIIYIKAQDDVDDGQIAVVLLDDSAALKHVYHIPNGLMLTSDNPKYPPMHMTFEDYNVIRVLGIVVGFTRMFNGSARV